MYAKEYGMFFNLFSKQVVDTQIDKKRLVDVVIKSNALNEGTFGNISNDLGDSVANLKTPMLQMAYAYARRSAAAGLFLQGGFDRNTFNYVQQIFESFQLTTNHSRKFQEDAAAQSLELMQSYDFLLTKDVIAFITAMALHNHTPEQYNGKSYLTYETVIMKVLYALEMQNRI